jgi:membrane protein required for colicin V production
MNIVDYIVIVFLLLFFWRGFARGFIGTLAWLAGLIIGTWLAGQFYVQVGIWLDQWIHNQSIAALVSFIGVLVVSMGIVGLLFAVANKMFNMIPVIGFINHLLGGLLGLVEALLLAGMIFWFVTLIPLHNAYTKAIADAKLRQPVTNVSAAIRWFLPQSLKAVGTLDLQAVGFPDNSNFSAEKLLNSLSPEQQQQVENGLQVLDGLTPEQQALLYAEIQRRTKK